LSKKALYNFITIEGNIGAGKTTLATKIAMDNNAHLILERFDDNPFLPKFYEESEKYAFPLELSFLAERHQQLKNELTKQGVFKANNSIVSDYYFVKSLIFARANLGNDEYELYAKLFHIINNSLPKPDLFIYLHLTVDRLQENIKKRGRNYEQNISNDYLIKIQNAYFGFLKQLNDLRVLVIDVNNIDFANNSNDYKKLVTIINQPYDTGIISITV
jgi:deoxyguanosine kinase